MKTVLTIYKNISMHNLKKALNYGKQYGISGLFARLMGKNTQQSSVSYEEFVKKTMLTQEQLQVFRDQKYAYEPLISVIVAGSQEETEDWMQHWKQTYSKYELLTMNSLTDPKEAARTFQSSRGEYVVFVAATDRVEETALSKVVERINENRAEMLYVDEDEFRENLEHRGNPFMKPDYNPDLLRSCNYFGRLCFIGRKLIDQLALFVNEKTEQGAGTAWYYDLLLKASIQAIANASHQREQHGTQREGQEHILLGVEHLAEVLLHTNEDPVIQAQYRMKAVDVLAVLDEHLKDCGIHAHAEIDEQAGKILVENGVQFALTRVVYELENGPAHLPLVSVVIPNKDHIDDLERCILSIEEQTEYPNYEIIIVENNSVQKETFQYYKKLEDRNPHAHVIYWMHEFNYSAICNYGANYCKGEYILFLNNDTRLRSDCITEMAGICSRPEVGVVGAKMTYDDRTIQSAGVIVGLKGVADSIMVGEPEEAYLHRGRSLMCQEYSAVTAACMMTTREIFRKTGGFCESLPVAFNDIDYCLNVLIYGKMVLYTPYAKCYHFESKSRGTEKTFSQVRRFKKEIAFFLHEWRQFLKHEDPNYNRNLSLDRGDYSYRNISEVKE